MSAVRDTCGFNKMLGSTGQFELRSEFLNAFNRLTIAFGRCGRRCRTSMAADDFRE
jgi:hypothetical protein